MKRIIVPIFTLMLVILSACSSTHWIPLFDGETLNGWQAAENPDTWKVENGCLVTHGPRSHLFYVGDVQNHNFKNFIFTADVKTMPGSNSGIYFHTQYQESGWPSKGYEAQVCNTTPPAKPGDYVEHKMTGSIYAIRNTWKSPAKDNEWFKYRIAVQGKTIRVFINNELISDYTEPENTFRPDDKKGRLLSSGTFALQGHDPGSIVYYKNIKVKPLADNLPTPGIPNDDPELEKKLVTLAERNFPLVDLHVHLKQGFTLEEAMKNARKYGFTYGIAINCGLQMGYETDEQVQAFLDNYKKPANSWLAVQAEGREWLTMFSKKMTEPFDYVFTDAMTWTNKNGKRMRLWMPEETEIGDPQDFMDQLVDNIVKIVTTEPIQIHVNPTYLPDPIMDRYDELWTTKRMDKVIAALKKANVALEINNRYHIPSKAFILRAKEAGLKFTFGTNNAGPAEIGNLDWCMDMALECGLTTNDMWLPQ